LIDIKKVLDERGSQYGDFRTQGFIAQRMKEIARETTGFDRMEDYQREAVEMIIHKLSRLLNGNPDFVDSWVDIEGYARCVSTRLSKGIDTTPPV
jgi:hypothetical protein